MEVYLFTIFLLFVFSLLEENVCLPQVLKQGMFFFIYCLFVVQVGLRWETGTDWEPYHNHFEDSTGFLSILISDFEYGYGLFEWLMKFISDNYSILLLVHAAIFYLIIFNCFKRYTPNLYLSLMLFYTLTMGIMGSNRQLFALAICLYAVRYIIDRKAIRFYLLVFVATLFHTTAYFFAIYYFLNKKMGPVLFIIILGSAFIIGKTQLPFLLFSHIGDLFGGMISFKTQAYTDYAKTAIAEANLSTIGLIKRVVFLLLFYYNRRQLREKFIYYNVILNGYFVGIVIYFLFANSLLIMVNRGSLYFTIMEPLLLALQLSILKGINARIIGITILFIFSIIFFFQSISGYSDLFIPYKGVFINTDFKRNMY